MLPCLVNVSIYLSICISIYLSMYLYIFVSIYLSIYLSVKVVLKIIKHCQDEGSAGEPVQGVLLGLIQNNQLEITNCFPFPSTRAGEDDDEDDGKKKCEN